MECSVCCELRDFEELQQILPCLHVFCIPCVERWKESTKNMCIGYSKDINQKPQKFIVVCLAVDCFTRIRKGADDRLNLRMCDNENCCRRLSFTPLEHLACLHDVCYLCFDEAKIESQPANCPVDGCGEVLMESEDGDVCAGECARPLVCGQFVVTKCCSSRICFQCIERMLNRKVDSREEVRCPGPCLGVKEDPGEEEQAWALETCRATPNCPGIPVSGFPSKFECEHDTCLGCLEKMLDNCVETCQMPHCPAKACEMPYCIESTVALRGLFPRFAPYFEELNLNVQPCMAIVEKTATELKLVPNGFNAPSRFIKVKVEQTDGLAGVVEFDKQAPMADFLREARRELRIVIDKVYGYYLRHARQDDEKDDEARADDELDVTPELLKKTVESVGVQSGSTLIVDTRGCVRPKEPAAD